MPFPLAEALKELFDSMKKSLGIYQFPNPETDRPYSKNINRIFNRAAKKAGIEINLNEWGRKSFAMQALQSIEKGMVSHLLRHQDPRMIDHYAEYQTEPLKSALDKIQTILIGSNISKSF
jgi:integrase